MRAALAWIFVCVIPTGCATRGIDEWPSITLGSVEFVTTTEFTQRLNVGPESVEFGATIHGEERYDVTEHSTDGTVTLHVRRGRIWGAFREGEETTEFDTARPDPLPRAAQPWVDALLPHQVFEIDPNGIVLSARVVDDQGRLCESNDHDRETVQVSFVQRPPDGPIVRGRTWDPELGIHECTPDGCVAFETTNTIAEFDADSITIESRAEPPSSIDLPGFEPILRRVELSRRDGLPITMRVTGTQVREQRDARLEIEMRWELQRAPTHEP
ncbi:MAG: hypothetical protein KDB80_03635 [Planctomycetes bacterium]|nr:hypothetical protein [Planctomycetota bacterium]